VRNSSAGERKTIVFVVLGVVVAVAALVLLMSTLWGEWSQCEADGGTVVRGSCHEGAE
jgi:hypothetical protein